MDRPRPALRAAALGLVALGLTACADDVTRVDEAEEPTILQNNADEIVTEAP